MILDIDERAGVFDREADGGGYRSQELEDALEIVRQEIRPDPSKLTPSPVGKGR